jgi:apolipoprotein N-acyltransferase
VLALSVSGARRGAALLSAAVAVGAGPLWFAGHPGPRPVRAVQVALVQPGVIHDEQPRYTAQVRDTVALIKSRVDLVVWGESSADHLAQNPAHQAQLAQLSRRLGAEIMVNGRSVLPSGDQYNTSYLIGPQGISGQYSKTRLVMFGEYIPLRAQLGWLDRVTKAAGVSLVGGPGPVRLSAGGLRIAPLICFESAFPDMARTDAIRGAQLIVYQSADSTFQNSWAPAQHAALAAVRAAEVGRPTVQGALSGVSAVYDARGRRLAWLPAHSSGSSVVSVPVSSLDTPYDRYGDYIPACCAAVAGGALAAHTRKAYLARRRRAHVPACTAGGAP